MLPGGSGLILPTLRHASGPGKLQSTPSPPAEGPRRSSRGVSRRPFVPDVLTGILVDFQGFSELSGGQKTVLTSSRSNRTGGCQASDLGDHVVDTRREGAAKIVPPLRLATEIGLTCA